MVKKGMVSEDVSENLKAPRIEKKMPEILTMGEVVRLLEQPGRNTPKEIRDRAMLELLYATGIRVSELISLQITDLNLRLGYIYMQGFIEGTCHTIWEPGEGGAASLSEGSPGYPDKRDAD